MSRSWILSRLIGRHVRFKSRTMGAESNRFVEGCRGARMRSEEINSRVGGEGEGFVLLNSQ